MPQLEQRIVDNNYNISSVHFLSLFSLTNPHIRCKENKLINKNVSILYLLGINRQCKFAKMSKIR